MKRTWMAALVTLGIAACADATGQGGSGRTQVLLTDAPAALSDLARVDVYIAKIEANTTTDTSGEAPSHWTTIATPARAYNLLELQHGTTVLAGEVDLPAGLYRAVRMTINTSLSHVTRLDGSEVTVHWPVTGELPLNALVENALEVPEGGAQIVIDFDVSRTFLDDGSGGLFFLPWFRAVNNAETGSVSGTVTAPDIEGHATPIEGATIIVSHAASMGILGSIAATSRTDANGHYFIGWLRAGEYRVGVQAPPQFAFNEGSSAITVTTGHESVANFNLTRDTTSGGGTDTTSHGGGTGPVATVEVRVWQTFAPTDSVGAYAELRNAGGALLYGRAVTWTVSDPTVAQIVWASGQSVLLRSLKAGTITLTATSEGKTNSAQLTLAAPGSGGGGGGGGTITTMAISPASISAAVNDSIGAYANLYNQNGAPVTLSGRNVTFTVSDSTVVRIQGVFGQSVLMKALKAGTVTLTGRLDAIQATASITVH